MDKVVSVYRVVWIFLHQHPNSMRHVIDAAPIRKGVYERAHGNVQNFSGYRDIHIREKDRHDTPRHETLTRPAIVGGKISY